MVSCCLGLSACSNLDPRLNPAGAPFAQRMTHLTETYNQRYGTHYPVPHLSIDEMPSQPTVVSAAEYSAWTVHINRLWVLKDPCTVDREALAHELAHLFVYYDEYGPPQTALLNTNKGMQLVAMNGPGLLQDSTVEHGVEWQAKARALGADPCREGYCYSAKPYKKYPLSCPATQTALAAAR